MTAVRVAEASQAPELDVARDLARRATWLVPVAVLVGLVGWGWPGAASALQVSEDEFRANVMKDRLTRG